MPTEVLGDLPAAPLAIAARAHLPRAAAVAGSTPWPYPELEFLPYAATDVIHAAADTGDRTTFRALGAPRPLLGRAGGRG
ncbi:hypothetical protein [Kitasatospora sp. NBC_00315]|uniref:hypothetical protein n=1 Tax=Kitasatospora sp. NBC_00315 TaxID=2975963 RepID=UPI00324814CC